MTVPTQKKSLDSVHVLSFVYVFYHSYREKAMQDAAAVSKHVEYLLQSVGKVSRRPFYVGLIIE